MKERLIKMSETSVKANAFQRSLTTFEDVEEMIKTDLIGRNSTGQRSEATQRSRDNEDSFGSADIFDLDSLEKLKIDCNMDGMPGQQGTGSDSPLQRRPQGMLENGWKADGGQASTAIAGKQGKRGSDLKSNVAVQGSSPGDLLADIAAVIAADTLIGISEHHTNSSAEHTTAAPKTSSASQPTNTASGTGRGRMTPNDRFYLESSPGQRSGQSAEEDLIDLIQLEESRLNHMPFDSESAASTPKSSDTLQAFEVEGESSLCFLEFNEDSVDSLEQCEQCNSILVEKGGKRGRPARQKVERPTHYHPILPRPPLPNGQLTTCPYHVPQRTVCVRPLESSFSTPSPQTSDTVLTASTRSRDSFGSDRDFQGYRCDASSGTTGSSRHSSSDTDGPHHNVSRLNNGASSVSTRPTSFQLGSPLYTSADINMTSHTQIRPCLAPLEQSFSGDSFMNNTSYMMYPSNMTMQSSTLPQNCGKQGLYEPGHHGLRSQHHLASDDRSVTRNGTGLQHYNQQSHPGSANHLVTQSEKRTNNIAAVGQAPPFHHLDPSYSMHGATSIQSPMTGHGPVPSMTVNGAICNHFSPALTGSSNATLPQNGYHQSATLQEQPQKEMLASSVSKPCNSSSGGLVKCNISSYPTYLNVKPKLDLPYEKKDSIVCQWINSHVGDPPPDSGCYPNQSLTDFGNHEPQMLGLFGQRIESPESQRQPKSKASSKRQSGTGSPSRAAMRSKASASEMSFTSSSTPSSFNLHRADGNSEMFRHNLGTGCSPLIPFRPRPQSEFQNGMSRSSIEEVEKINADLEIEINIIEMKEKSLENHKGGPSLPADCETKLSSLEDILLSGEGDISLLAGVGLSASQFSNSSSFDRSKYLTPNDISSLEAKKHQSGKTSFDEYLGNPVAMSQPNEPAQKASGGQGHPVYFNPDFGPEVRGLMTADHTAKASSDRSNSQHMSDRSNSQHMSDRSNSQHMSKPVKRKPEDAQRATNFLLNPFFSPFLHLNGATHQQMHNSRRNLVEQWINHLPFERNSLEQQCFSSFQHPDMAQAINAQSAQPTPLTNGLVSNWTEPKMASAGLSNQHPVSTSDASMMSESGMSIENSLGQFEEHQHNALMNGLMDVVDMVTTSMASNEQHSANCDAGSKQSMDDYHFSKVMNFLEPDMVSPHSAHLFSDTVPQLSNTNSCNYLRNHLLQQASCQSASGRNQASPFASAMPSFDDGLILSPRGPGAEKASAKAVSLGASNVQSPAGDQQPAEITISSLDSSKISGDSYLSKLSYSSIPEQVMGPDSDGETCLHFLCDMPTGSLEEIKQQPGFREALDLQNKKQETALFIAVKRSNVEITNFLLSNGANPNIICSSAVQGLGAIQHSALHEAVLAGNLRIVRALLSAKDIVVDAKSSYGGITPLMLALAFHKTNKEKDIIMLLIEKKASLTLQETQGRTPLMLAIQSRDVGLVETILTVVGPVTARALVTAADKKGLTCLHIAAGLNLNTQDKKRLLQCIITAGGDASVKNIEGETPRDWAKNEVTEVLQNLAKVNKT